MPDQAAMRDDLPKGWCCITHHLGVGMYIGAVSWHTPARDRCHRVDVLCRRARKNDADKGRRERRRAPCALRSVSGSRDPSTLWLLRFAYQPLRSGRRGTEVCYQDLFRYRPIRLVGLRRVTVAGADEADTPNAIVCYMQVFAEL